MARKKANKKEAGKEKQECWFDKKKIIIISIAVLIAIILAVILYSKSNGSRITGDAVSVKYWGVSNYPLKDQANKIQAEVKISQPDLKNLATANNVMVVAKKITDAADFVNNIASVATGSVPTPIPTSILDAVVSLSGKITQGFLDDTVCLRKIGKDYGSKDSIEFVVVTDIGYSVCGAPYTDWNVAKIRHTYYTKDGKKICQQMGTKLFTIQQMTGKTSSSTLGC